MVYLSIYISTPSLRWGRQRRPRAQYRDAFIPLSFSKCSLPFTYMYVVFGDLTPPTFHVEIGYGLFKQDLSWHLCLFAFLFNICFVILPFGNLSLCPNQCSVPLFIFNTDILFESCPFSYFRILDLIRDNCKNCAQCSLTCSLILQMNV